MNKAKVIKTCIKAGALLLAGVVTILNDKVTKTEMDEAVAAKVAEALANQAEES